ncbi:MAG TPA: AMP-binding acetyl-CoA synthetase, partial [Spirochaetota bacterium]|nr:AMP-binding acetyl-CoA synthetase [Spirochaetota bacterium]
MFKTSKGKYVHPVPLENLLNASPYVELSVVLGLGYPQPVAVVMLAEGLRGRQGDPAVRAEVTAALQALLKEVNDRVAEFERLDFIVVARDEWTVDAGMLTPTLKIRRAQIEALYKQKCDAWVESGQKVIWEE